MRIGPSTVATAQTTARDVEPKRTPVTRDDIRGAIARAHTKVTGQAPSAATLDVLTAQASLETASGASMYNYNFGGIKGASPSGETAHLQTHEVLNGKDVVIKDGFRAYKSLDEGATDYVRLMQNRFPGAVAQAQQGNVDGFAGALKKAGYYTADEKAYASGLRSLMGASGGGTSSSSQLNGGTSMIPSLPNVSSMYSGASAPDGFADGSQLSRVMEAIGHHHEVVSDDDDD
jgi:hypothetical protein